MTTGASSLGTSVKKVVEETLKIPSERLDIDADFSTFGMDSIIALELMSNLANKLKVNLTPAEFINVSTVRELAEHIEKTTAVVEEKVSKKSDVSETVVESNRVQDLPVETKESTHTGKPKRRGERKKRIRSRAGNGGVKKEVYDWVYDEYGLDLTHIDFDDVDQIVDYISQNYPDLLNDGQALNRHKTSNTGRDYRSSAAGSSTLDIAIVGIGCRFPGAKSPEEFWRNMMDETVMIKPVPSSRWDEKHYYSEKPDAGKTVSKWGALVEEHDCFDYDFFGMDYEQAALVDPQERLLLESVYHAIEDAGIAPSSLKGSDTSVFVGYEYSEYEQFLRKSDARYQGYPVFSSSSPVYYLANRISYFYDFNGASESINVNCASSAAAINRACISLASGESNIAIAAGVCLNLFQDDYIYSSQFGMLSPTGTCGVFDEAADGFTRGEGVGVLMLKPLSQAEADNDRIYAVIRNVTQVNRGAADDLSEIKHESITQCLQKSYADSDSEFGSLRYLEVDGYATKWGDSFEFEGIKNALGSNKTSAGHCALGSLKGTYGHTEPASGIASVIKVATSLYKKEFPPTITVKKLSSFVNMGQESHFYIADKRLPVEDLRESADKPAIAGVNSFADSGVNIHIQLEEYLTEQNTSDSQQNISELLFPFSAKTDVSLRAYLADFLKYIKSNDVATTDMISVAKSLQMAKTSLEIRLAVLAKDLEELVSALSDIIDTPDLSSLSRKNILYGELTNVSENSLVGMISPDIVETKIAEAINGGNWADVALMWTNGVEVTWNKAWQGKGIKNTTIPGYAFEKKKVWYGDKEEATTSSDVIKTAVSTGPNVKPKNKTERTLRKIWSEQFSCKVGDICVVKDFFELGGDSKIAMSIFSRVAEDLGVTLSPANFMKNSSIRGIAEFIEAGPENASIERLVRLNAETNESIFVLPGAAGGVLSYNDLGEVLNESYCVYGIQASGLNDGEDIAETAHDAASDAIKQMNTLDLNTPCHLLGYSNGGIVAYEMARKIHSEGGSVASLTIVDTLCPSKRNADIEEEIIAICKEMMEDIGAPFDIDVSTLKGIDEAERADFILNKMLENGYEIPRSVFISAYNLAVASEKSSASYLPEKLDKSTKVLLVTSNSYTQDGETADEGASEENKYLGWEQYLHEGFGHVKVNCEHLALLEKENVEVWAPKLSEHMSSKS